MKNMHGWHGGGVKLGEGKLVMGQVTCSCECSFDQFVIIFRSFSLPLIDPNNSVWRLLCPKFKS